MALKGERRPSVECVDRPHPCIDTAKYQDWPFVPYVEQTVEYFAKVQDLNNCGLNPQSELNKLDIIEADLIEVFGPLKRFTMSNLDLHRETLEELKEKYWRCYGMDDVMNNNFMK